MPQASVWDLFYVCFTWMAFHGTCQVTASFMSGAWSWRRVCLQIITSGHGFIGRMVSPWQLCTSAKKCFAYGYWYSYRFQACLFCLVMFNAFIICGKKVFTNWQRRTDLSTSGKFPPRILTHSWEFEVNALLHARTHVDLREPALHLVWMRSANSS